jgi:hypothetical protein
MWVHVKKFKFEKLFSQYVVRLGYNSALLRQLTAKTTLIKSSEVSLVNFKTYSMEYFKSILVY